eukprot:910835-Prorocentrum_lima.AAC.1
MKALIEKLRKGGGKARGEGLASVTAEAIWPRCSSSWEVRKEGRNLLGCERRDISARNEWFQRTGGGQ